MTLATTIIVPLFGRIDLVEAQLAAMSGDADLRDAEILYVLDSPELSDELRSKAKQLAEEHQLAVRVVVMRESCGFAAAVNVGVSKALAADVVIMHSDVVPAGKGWLGAMKRTRDVSQAAAVGALLLYADDSIQHAGYIVGNNATIEQPFKGLHRDLLSEGHATKVQAVSAACMLLSRSAFVKAGGMSGSFVDGTFEDVDLCRRIVADGGKIAWTPSAHLYHLEGQSTPQRQRDAAKPYSAFLARLRWTHPRRFV